METVLKWITAIGGAVHWLTGWLIHPDRGGCCHTEEINEKFNNLKNEEK